MEVIGIATSDELSDAVIPVACAFASSMVVARVLVEYFSMGDPARTNWLCLLQREGRLGLVRTATCVWLVILSSPHLCSVLFYMPHLADIML